VKPLKELLPRASKSFLAANPHPVSETQYKTASTGIVGTAKTKPRKMTTPELEFAFILERMKRNDEIADYKYEGITLRWDGLRYTPDFIVFPSPLAVSSRIKLIEVKGPFIVGNRARAVERFRHARTYWTQFDLELHQRTKADGWKRLL
jgi:hypothetical protein